MYYRFSVHSEMLVKMLTERFFKYIRVLYPGTFHVQQRNMLLLFLVVIGRKGNTQYALFII